MGFSWMRERGSRGVARRKEQDEDEESAFVGMGVWDLVWVLTL